MNAIQSQTEAREETVQVPIPFPEGKFGVKWLAGGGFWAACLRADG